MAKNILLVLMMGFSLSYAHQVEVKERCSTDPVDSANAKKIDRHMDFYGDFIMNNLLGAEPYFKRDIKVYFFVDKDFSSDVTDEALIKQVEVLNSAFAFSDDELSVVLKFVLADIQRVEFPNKNLYNDGKTVTKLRKGTNRDLNIFITDLDGLLGFARFPWNFTKEPKIDGVSLDYRTLPGGKAEKYNLGATGTHEVGHWLGLYHTFQDSCSKLGDRVEDTPSERSATFGCPEKAEESCKGAGPVAIENFMNYTDDACMNRFSRGQFERVIKSLILFR